MCVQRAPCILVLGVLLHLPAVHSHPISAPCVLLVTKAKQRWQRSEATATGEPDVGELGRRHACCSSCAPCVLSGEVGRGQDLG